MADVAVLLRNNTLSIYGSKEPTIYRKQGDPVRFTLLDDLVGTTKRVVQFKQIVPDVNSATLAIDEELGYVELPSAFSDGPVSIKVDVYYEFDGNLNLCRSKTLNIVLKSE